MNGVFNSFNYNRVVSGPGRGERGFTLIEVMVALTIVVLGMAAVWASTSQATLNASRLEKKTFANWIAMNRITEMRLERAWPDPGRSDGDVTFANHEWRWFANVTQTQVEAVKRVDMSVVLQNKPDEALITVTGFLGKPAAGNTAVTPWAGIPGALGPGQPGGDQPGNPGRSGRRK